MGRKPQIPFRQGGVQRDCFHIVVYLDVFIGLVGKLFPAGADDQKGNGRVGAEHAGVRGIARGGQRLLADAKLFFAYRDAELDDALFGVRCRRGRRELPFEGGTIIDGPARPE